MGERAIIRVRAAGLVFGSREGEDDPGWTTVMVPPGTEGALLGCGTDGYSVLWDRAFAIPADRDGGRLDADDGSLAVEHRVAVECRYEPDDLARSPWFEFVGVRNPDPVRATAEALDEDLDEPWRPRLFGQVWSRPHRRIGSVISSHHSIGADPTYGVEFDDGHTWYGLKAEELAPATDDDPTPDAFDHAVAELHDAQRYVGAIADTIEDEADDELDPDDEALDDIIDELDLDDAIERAVEAVVDRVRRRVRDRVREGAKP